MSSLLQLLNAKGYHRIKFALISTNHLELVVAVNSIEGRFILDTGASSSCIGFDSVAHFELEAEDSDIKAAGAGAVNMLTQVSTKNELTIGTWRKRKIDFVLFDLKHVNQALEEHNAKKVHGILGADVLKKGKAVIDYSKKNLYLK
ncbi:hypothetical protein GCM10009117_06720 [Gangjinia marincola]|uniref:Acid protease n=1 Tax=Gangjinia marincola TaxID=578463 RepID=A0ABN1MEJ3_9FLAO